MRKYRENWKQILLALWLLLSVGLALYVIARNHFNLFNSDDASELLLAEIVSHGNGVFSRDWISSTEMNVWNTQIIRGFLFRFTDSWLTIRIVGNFFLYLWLLLSYAFFVVQSGMDRKWFWYTSPFLMIPFSHEQFYMVALAAYYIPYMALSFLILGCWGYLYRTDGEERFKKRRALAHVSAVLLSFGACLGGIRQLLVTFLPMLASVAFLLLYHSKRLEGFREVWRRTYFLWTSLLAGFVGYVLNMKVLAKLFLFDTYGEMNLIQFRFDRIQVILRYFLNACGYVEDADGVPLFSEKGIQYLLALVFVAMLIFLLILLGKNFRRMKPASQFLYLSTLTGLALHVGIGVFTDISFAGRYYILHLVLYAPLLAVLYEETDLARWMRQLLFGIFVAVVCILGTVEYKNCLDSRLNESRREVISYLEGEEYALGYASFWNANIMTELTNGSLKMVSLECERGEEPSLFPWLVRLSDLAPVSNREHVYLYLHHNELNRYASLIEGREPAYEDGTWYIYDYTDTDEFLSIINGSKEE